MRLPQRVSNVTTNIPEMVRTETLLIRYRVPASCRRYEYLIDSLAIHIHDFET